MRTTPNSIAELAIAMPNCIPVLQRLKIDYCCHGNQTIQEACLAAGISAEELMDLIGREPAAAETRSWDDQSLTDIIRFIVDTHHAYTRQTCETLQWMSKKVANRHGENHPELVELDKLVARAIDDLIPHMMKEEQILFPYVEQLEAGDAPMPFFGTARNPVRMMMMEHEAVGDLLVQMRSVTKDYEIPDGACTTFRAYFTMLQGLERDLHNHIHVENNVLFPRSIELEDNTPKAMAGNW